MEKFANILKELIEENKLDEKALANQIGVTGATVSRWINDKMSIKLATSIKIADVFNCSLDYLFGRNLDFGHRNYKVCPPISEQLRRVLKEQNITQYRLIKDNVLNPYNINILLNKNGDVQIETIIKLADYLDVSLDYLVGRE